MKKTFLAAIIASSVMGVTGISYAADGTVKFTGNITADACTASAESQDLSVSLGTVSATSFSAAGDKSSPTKFTINLSDCPSSITAVSVKFDGISDTTSSNLLKLDSGSTATGVGVEISDVTGTPLPLHTASSPYAIAQDGTAALDFVGRYVSTTSSVGAGTADATAQFSINYQ